MALVSIQAAIVHNKSTKGGVASVVGFFFLVIVVPLPICHKFAMDLAKILQRSDTGLLTKGERRE